MKFGQRKASLLLCVALLVVMVFVATGCNDTSKDTLPTASTMQESLSNTKQVLGEGNTEFTLTVTDKDGMETLFEIHTDQETVGAALKELELIDGEESEYGLYVKTVNGITADYDKDGVYWAFYINGEYASSGVDATSIVEENNYTLKVE